MKKPTLIDTSFSRAARVMVRDAANVSFFLVGCGGTGSFLAPSIARLAADMIAAERSVSIQFIDYDRVESGNIPRQNFCYAEEGQFKAVTLATRLSRAWNIPITAITEKYQASFSCWQCRPRRGPISLSLQVVIGCVDNAAARKALARSLSHHHLHGQTWWLDCGNTSEAGQVLLGSAPNIEAMMGAFRSSKICEALPSPAIQAPDLLKPRPEENKPKRLSCAELVARNQQSLMVNQQTAAIAADYLLRLVTMRPLRKFATYFDQESGSSSSLYITPSQIARTMKMPEADLMRPPEATRRRTG